MKRIFAHALRKFGVVDFDLLVRRAETFPADEAIRSGEVVFVIDGGIQKWACLKCPGGCGTTIPLSLSPTRRPRWSIVADWLQRPTVKPSVHQQNACGCHFWIRRGRIEWCEGGRPNERHGRG